MYTVAAFYRFAPIQEPAAVKPPLARLCRDVGVRGSILIAPEGINGTIAGPRAAIDAVVTHLGTVPGLEALDWKESIAAEIPFRRMKVRIKREIVTMGVPKVDPRAGTGHYVAPSDWNDLIAAPDVVLIDTRNAYEVAIGTFEGAVDPGTETFGAFPDWWAINKAQFAGKRVAMFCTGGIRCEKATSYLIRDGVDAVYHLQGGILKYLEEVPEADSRWRGECYVFDGRVSVGHGLAQGSHVMCHACGRPVSEADCRGPDFEKGVQCPACKDEYSAADRVRFRERQYQLLLSKARARP